MKLALVLALLAGPALAEVSAEAIQSPRPPKLLSEFGFFDDLAAGLPAPGVVPYSLTTALFTDYADKDRFIYTPAPAPYQIEKALEFPIGSAIVKTFRYGADRVETRVLLHQQTGWKAFPYVWNASGTDAELKLAGADLTIQTEHGTIAYHVPNANQCKGCHFGADKAAWPIGPKIRNLNSGDQLARLVAAGVLAQAPADAPALPDAFDESQPVAARARAYLDVNCAHCHAPGLPADTSGLYLNWEEDRPDHLGVMKRPVAAGRASGEMEFVIVPGDPDNSILLYRMLSGDPGIMMPELGRTIAHDPGLVLIRQWIAEMEP